MFVELVSGGAEEAFAAFGEAEIQRRWFVVAPAIDGEQVVVSLGPFEGPFFAGGIGLGAGAVCLEGEMTAAGGGPFFSDEGPGLAGGGFGIAAEFFELGLGGEGVFELSGLGVGVLQFLQFADVDGVAWLQGFVARLDPGLAEGGELGGLFGGGGGGGGGGARRASSAT